MPIFSTSINTFRLSIILTSIDILFFMGVTLLVFF
jgi:hypothetical protein